MTIFLALKYLRCIPISTRVTFMSTSHETASSILDEHTNLYDLL